MTLQNRVDPWGMVYGGGVVLADLGAMTVSGEMLLLGALAVPFTIFATIGVINATEHV